MFPRHTLKNWRSMFCFCQMFFLQDRVWAAWWFRIWGREMLGPWTYLVLSPQAFGEALEMLDRMLELRGSQNLQVFLQHCCWVLFKDLSSCRIRHTVLTNLWVSHSFHRAHFELQYLEKLAVHNSTWLGPSLALTIKQQLHHKVKFTQTW